MKRKTIQLAGKTLVVSLPAKWVHQQGVKKGDEVEILEEGGTLRIGAGASSPPCKKVQVNFRGLNERTIHWLLSAVHKKGYDEIECFFDDAHAVEIVHTLLKDLFIGFVILEQSEKRCVLKHVAQDTVSEFDAALRRNFLIGLSMGESCVKLLRQSELKKLEGLLYMEALNNQLCNFCERLINKNVMSDEQKCFWYVIVWNLEKVVDEYKYICVYLKDKKIKVDGELIMLFENVNALLRKYYELFYKFDSDALPDLFDEKKRLDEAGEKILGTSSKEMCVVTHHLLCCASHIIDFSTSMIALRYEGKKQV